MYFDSSLYSYLKVVKMAVMKAEKDESMAVMKVGVMVALSVVTLGLSK